MFFFGQYLTAFQETWEKQLTNEPYSPHISFTVVSYHLFTFVAEMMFHVG